MRYLSSRPFVVGLLLMAGGILSMPLFVTLGEGNCSTPSPENPSWDCFQPSVFDGRIPIAIAAGGLALMLFAAVRVRRSGAA